MKKTLFAISTLLTINAHAIPTELFIGQVKRMIPKTKNIVERTGSEFSMLVVQDFDSKRKLFGITFLSEMKELDEGSYHEITKQVVFDFPIQYPSMELRNEIFQHLYVNSFNSFAVDVNDAGFLVIRCEISIHADDQMVIEKMKDLYKEVESVHFVIMHESFHIKNVEHASDLIKKIMAKKKPLN